MEWLFYYHMLQVEWYFCIHKQICLIFSHLSFTISPGYLCLCQSNNLKFIAKFTARIYFILYYFGILSILKVYLCVVFWLSMFGNHDRVSCAIYFSPRIFSISELYYSSMNLHCNTLLLLKYSYVRFLWSVYILRFLPNKIVQNYFRVYTMIRSSFSINFYLIYVLVIVELYN